MDMDNTKWFGRSRQIWTIFSVALFACIGAAREMGVELPLGLEASIDGAIQALLGLVAAGLGTWSLFRPDNAMLTMLPNPGNTPISKTIVLKGAGSFGVLLVALFLFATPARAADPECSHMCTDPVPSGVVFEVVSGNISICTPCVSGLGNRMPDGLMIDECIVEFGGGGSVYSVQGPFDQASVVLTPIPAALEFDHPIEIWCIANSTEGAALAAVARFPFSGPGSPGVPR
jgi:hypothetical protein